MPDNAYGVLTNREFAPTLELGLHLHPATKNVVVISGTSEFDKGLLAQAQTGISFIRGEECRSHISRKCLSSNFLQRVSQLDDRTIVLFLTVFQDGTGQALVTHEVVERVANAASVPVYAFLDQFLGRGIVGGHLYSTTELGAVTAKVVLRLLSDELPQQRVFNPTTNKPMFDRRQLQRWGISEGLLPPGSEIRFRELSAWQRYPWQIALTIAVLSHTSRAYLGAPA